MVAKATLFQHPEGAGGLQVRVGSLSIVARDGCVMGRGGVLGNGGRGEDVWGRTRGEGVPGKRGQWASTNARIPSLPHLLVSHSFIRSPARLATGAPVPFPVAWVDGGVGRALHRCTAHLEKREHKGSWLWSQTDLGFHLDSWLSHL